MKLQSIVQALAVLQLARADEFFPDFQDLINPNTSTVDSPATSYSGGESDSLLTTLPTMTASSEAPSESEQTSLDLTTMFSFDPFTPSAEASTVITASSEDVPSTVSPVTTDLLNSVLSPATEDTSTVATSTTPVSEVAPVVSTDTDTNTNVAVATSGSVAPPSTEAQDSVTPSNNAPGSVAPTQSAAPPAESTQDTPTIVSVVPLPSSEVPITTGPLASVPEIIQSTPDTQTPVGSAPGASTDILASSVPPQSAAPPAVSASDTATAASTVVETSAAPPASVPPTLASVPDSPSTVSAAPVPSTEAPISVAPSAPPSIESIPEAPSTVSAPPIASTQVPVSDLPPLVSSQEPPAPSSFYIPPVGSSESGWQWTTLGVTPSSEAPVAVSTAASGLLSEVSSMPGVSQPVVPSSSADGWQWTTLSDSSAATGSIPDTAATYSAVSGLPSGIMTTTEGPSTATDVSSGLLPFVPTTSGIALSGFVSGTPSGSLSADATDAIGTSATNTISEVAPLWASSPSSAGDGASATVATATAATASENAIGQTISGSPSGDVPVSSAGTQSAGDVRTTSAPAPTTLPSPNGADSTNFLPTGLITEGATGTATTTQSGPSDNGNTASATPTSSIVLPRVIAPSAVPSLKPGQVQVRVGFKYGLNYPFVVSHPLAAAQIFQYLPQGVQYGLQADSSQVVMKELAPYMKPGSNYLSTIARIYIPENSLDELSSQINSTNSRLYSNPDGTINTLIGLIDTDISLIEDTDDDSGGNSGFGSQSNADPGPAAVGALGSLDQATQAGMKSKPSGQTAGIAVGSLAGAFVLGSVLLLGTRKYRKKVALDAESFDDGSVVSPYHDDSDRSSLGSSSGASVREVLPVPAGQGPAISQPVMSENSLGWL